MTSTLAGPTTPARLGSHDLRAGPATASWTEPGTETGHWDVEVAHAVLTLAGLAGFSRVFSGTGWVGPVVGSALGVQLVCRLTRRYINPPLVAALVDLGAVLAFTVWTVVPASTTYGVPRARTWHVVEASLNGVAARMQMATVPTRPFIGFLVLATLGAGIVSLAGSWIVFRLGRILATAIPSVSALVTCCALGTRAGRDRSVGLEIVATAVFLAVTGLRSRARGDWLGTHGDSADGLSAGGAVPATVIAVIAALVVVSGLAPADGHGLLGWRSAGGGPSRKVFSPLVDLATKLLPGESATHVFTVDSPVSSYWRLTSLDDFDGSEWKARDTYQSVDEKLPGLVHAPGGTRVVQERFDIQALDSAWLPLAFDPVSVTGAGPVSYDPASDSLITPASTSNRLDYTVTALEYLDTLSARDLRSAPPLTRSEDRGALAPYEALPPSVSSRSSRVAVLARSIVAGRTTEYGKALALENFFHGPQFTYSLRPPTDGSGDAALENFLFVTRTGYCQQFAGSYAVLARAVGLPTRLAVGFTTGRSAGPQRYQVTDGDAHTWPEVWFPHYGWVPFEPTKGTAGHGFAIPGATAYTGDTAAVAPSKVATTPTTTPTTATTLPSTTPTTTPSSSKGTPHNYGKGGGVTGPTPSGLIAPLHHYRSAGHDHHTDRTLVVAIGLLGAALAVWMGLNLVGRRQRWARRRRRDIGPLRIERRYPATAVSAVWEEVAERLAWRGTRRRASETCIEFAQRVTIERRLDLEIPLGSHLSRLAELLTAAQFGHDGIDGPDLVEAAQRAEQVRIVVARGLRRPARFRLLVDPRLAWSPVTVDPPGTPRVALA